jgi:5'-phosphate synthase pdxT subunit
MKVGILALQGDFELHQQRLRELGSKPLLVRHSNQLSAIDALIVPGGESTTLLKLLDEQFRTTLCHTINQGTPVLATCAGLILLANTVNNPSQQSLQVIDIDITRNAYGRQIDSFIDPCLVWTERGKEQLREVLEIDDHMMIEGVFIRAPRITRVGKGVSVLIEHRGDPVLVKQGNVLGATFHPELSEHSLLIHQLLLGSGQREP